MSEVKKEDMNIVMVGHVDHGKSTLIGRLLADTHSLPEGKLAQVKETCRRTAKPFEYAFLLDALKDEQAQGITIDTARCFFKTEKRDYIILDAPGHIEFLKNMITGAARAQAAVLVIDAKEGVKENSKRHGYMLSMLGIRQIVVAINKMDLMSYQQEVFEQVKEEYLAFLTQLGITPMQVIPMSAFEGENVAFLSKAMPWYTGPTILQALDAFPCEQESSNQVFRMPVQDVYKFTKDGDDRRIVAGTIETGNIQVGDPVVFYPSGKKSKIKSIESFPVAAITTRSAGYAVGVTLEEQIYIKRGEIMTIDGETRPCTAKEIKVNLFWLGKDELILGKKYILKIGSERVGMKLKEILSVMNSSNLKVSKKAQIGCNEVAECILQTERPIAFDPVDIIAQTSRFVIVDGYEICGGGIVLNALEDAQTSIRNRVLLRNYKWELSGISMEERAERYSQKPLLFLFTGPQNVGKKVLAKELEKRLVKRGRFAYYLGIGTFLYGVDADIKHQKEVYQEEHIRRFAEVANLMLDSGLILIITARNLTKKDLEIMQTIISSEIQTVWIGENHPLDLQADIYIKEVKAEEDIPYLLEYLKEKNCIFHI